MEIEVMEKGKDRLTFRLSGASHTFCNHLKNALYEDSNVTTAAYNIDHPLVGTPTFIVEKKGGTFSKILSDAALRVKKQNKAFHTAFKKLK